MVEKADKIKSRDNYVSQKMQAVLNNLLGNYNESGTYVINDRIVKELVGLKKVCHDTSKGEAYCTAKTKTGKQFNFQIRVNTHPLKNVSVAKLYVMEDVSRLGGKQTSTIKTKIAKYTDSISDDFYNKALDYFNVTVTEEDKGREIKEDEQESSAAIEFRQTALGYVGRQAMDKFESSYERMFNEKFYYLRRNGSPFAKELLSIFFAEVNDASAYYYKDFSKRIPNYRAMYELLTDKMNELEMQGNYSNSKHYKDYYKLEASIAEKESAHLDGYLSDSSNFFNTNTDQKDFFDDLFDDIEKTFDKAADSISEFFSDMGNSIERGWDRVKEFFGFGGNDQQSIIETNPLDTGRKVDKFTQIDTVVSYSEAVQNNYGNLYANQLVESFGRYDASRDAGIDASRIGRTPWGKVDPSNVTVGPESFDSTFIDQKFELSQLREVTRQTELTLGDRIRTAGLGLEMSMKKNS